MGVHNAAGKGLLGSSRRGGEGAAGRGSEAREGGGTHDYYMNNNNIYMIVYIFMIMMINDKGGFGGLLRRSRIYLLFDFPPRYSNSLSLFRRFSGSLRFLQNSYFAS